MPATQTIPVVSLDDYAAGGASREQFIERSGRALQEIGFFALVDHGVSRELIHQAYRLAEDFFCRPDEEKLRCEDLASRGQRGFTSFGREQAKSSPSPDLKEFWHVGRELPPNHTLGAGYQPNIWPEQPAEFRPVFLELYSALDRCAATLLEALSIYIGEDAGLLPGLVRDGNTILRIIHYPPVPEEVDPAAMRAAPHEDINLITLLCEATAGGLELLQRDGTWLPVTTQPGQIIVDSGDMIQNLTNGLLKSTTHRVVNPGSARDRRFSMPFFVHPRSEASLSPLPASIARTGGRQLYPDIRAGEYLAQRLREIGLA